MKIPRPSERMSSSRRLFWGTIISFMVTGGLLGLGIFLFTPGKASAGLFLPVSLRSPFSADYSPDERGYALPPMDLDLAIEAARDRIPTAAVTGGSTSTPIDPAPTLMESFKTPVPTVTPQRVILFPTLTQAATVEKIFTATPLASPPGSLPTTPASPSATVSSTATPEQGITQAPSRTPTHTPAAPTKIPPATLTSLPSRTPVAPTLVSPIPPTATRIPATQTPMPIPATNTPIPPTAVPTDPPEPTSYPMPTDPPAYP